MFCMKNQQIFALVAKRAGIWIYVVLSLHVLSGIYDLPARGLCCNFLFCCVVMKFMWIPGKKSIRARALQDSRSRETPGRVLTLAPKHARLFGASKIESLARVLLPKFPACLSSSSDVSDLLPLAT
jgi:hypothetical protein